MSKQPLDWKTVRKYVYGGEIEKLNRSEKMSDAYQLWSNTIKKSYGSVSKYIFNEKLKFNSKNANKQFILTENNFPYNLSKDVKHLILWANPRNIPKDIKNSRGEVPSYYFCYMADQLAKELHGSSRGTDSSNFVIIFENPQHKKSIKTIPHYHIFVRNVTLSQLKRLNFFQE